MSYMNCKQQHTYSVHACMHACMKKKRLKIKNGKYRDGIKILRDKIGMVCDAYLRVIFVHNTIAPITQA